MSKNASRSVDARLTELADANRQLRAENTKLKAELEEHHGIFARGWHGFVITICVLLATLILIVGNILFWAGDTLVNNDRYVKTVTPVLQDKEVQAAVAHYGTVQIFNNVDVKQIVQDALPPRADFLAGTLTTQLEKGTEQTLKKVVASDKFQTTWAETNARAHERFITSIKNSKGDGVINLQELYERLADSLKGTKLSFLAGKTLPPKVGSIEVIHAEWVPKARKIIDSIGWIKPVSLLLVAIFSAAAIWLSRNRRKLVIWLGSFFAGGMLVSLIAFRITRNSITGHFAPAYQTAADHATRIIMTGLIEQTVTILLVSLLIVLIAWVTGPYRTARITRERIQLLLSGKLHEALFSDHESGFTRWVGSCKRIIQRLVVAFVIVIMLFVTLSPKLVFLYVLLGLVLVLVVEIIAAPTTRQRR